MTSATYLLLVIGLLGALDIAWFHTWRGRLVLRPEARREAWIHVARGFCYAAQLALIPNLRFTGTWYLAFASLVVIDVAIAVADVLEEPRARAAQGGLSGGEYLMHIVLSVLVGAYLYAVFSSSAAWWQEPAALTLEPSAPPWARLLAALMAASSALVASLEALVLIGARLPKPAPLHVRVRLRATLERVWNVTQDHRIHPDWDGRFSRIELLHEEAGPVPASLAFPDPRIRAGTMMRYERDLLGMTIRGFGRYKHHRPMRQSTFEFWSDDPRSLIRRGSGLWLYTPLPGGIVELSTSFTYEVRWGPLGAILDRCLFRPLFQRYTERSFRRLARRWFSEPSPRVLGRRGRRPEYFPALEAPR